MAIRLDPLSVATDRALAEHLSAAQWAEIIQSPEWAQLVAEQHELVRGVLDLVPGHLQIQQPPTAAQPQAPQQGDFSIIGTRVPRVQGLGIVTGQGHYTEHTNMAGQLYMRTLRSPHPHAKVKAIDTKKAEALSGVALVLHRGNLPAEYRDSKLGSGPPDRFLFNEEVFEVGAPIAVVFASSERIADEATRLIEVQYEILPATLDMMESTRSTTPKQWSNQLDGTIIGVTPPLVRGNADARGEVNVEFVANRNTEQHLPLEPTSSLAWWEADKLNMVYSGQWAHGTRSGLSQMLKIPQNKVRVVQPGFVGSGYGYRSGIDLAEVHAAIGAKMTGKPVKLVYQRYEDFVTRTHRPQFRTEVKLSTNRDGTLVSGNFKVYANVGAQRAAAANGSWYQYQMLYTIPNLKLEAIDVFTNSYKSGPYRCVSHPAGTHAMEIAMDKAAYAINMDPVEFRLKNLNETGNPDQNKPFSNPGMREVITQVADKIGWKSKWHAPKAKEVRPGIFHGIGFAAHACSHGGGGNPATGQVIVNTDGTVQCVSASNDIGPGQRTTMAMIAAEAVGVPLRATTITTYIDTDLSTDTSGTFGSQQTNNGGRGMYEAGLDARKQILEVAARKFVDDARRQNQTITLRGEDMDIKDGRVFAKADPSKTQPLSDIVQFNGGPIIGRSVFRQDPKWERVAWAAGAAEIEVDTVTGSIKVLNYVAGHDVGRAINPFALEQQVEGGVIMALGAALTEEMLIDKATGLPLNPNMLDYRPLTIKDGPERTDIILVEKPKEYGVFGSHGIGEPIMGPPGPVIANAVYNAVGVWVHDMPLTREKLLAALRGS